MIAEKKGKYPFLIANIDISSKQGTHLWACLTLSQNRHFLFDSFGPDDLKAFIIQENEKIIEKNLIWDWIDKKDPQ